MNFEKCAPKYNKNIFEELHGYEGSENPKFISEEKLFSGLNETELEEAQKMLSDLHKPQNSPPLNSLQNSQLLNSSQNLRGNTENTENSTFTGKLKTLLLAIADML